MNEFLGLLARRVLAPTTIRPRRLSRFEGDALAPSLVPPQIQPEANDRVAPRNVEPSRAPIPPDQGINSLPVIPPEPAIRSEPSREPKVPTIIEPLTLALAVMPALPLTLPPSLPEAVPPSDPVLATKLAPPVANGETPRSAAEQPEPRPVTPLIQSVERDRVTRELIQQRVERLIPADTSTVGPQAGALGSPTPASQAIPVSREPASVPVVEISIGRIEFLASAPPAQVSPAERTVTRREAQSLEAYLNQRNGRGGRP